MIELRPHGAGNEELAARLSGRPRNSPGWGKLVAVKSGLVIAKDGERCVVHAGMTRVVPEHWTARLHPELFKPADRRDSQTREAHRSSLGHAQHDLERQLGTAPSRARRPRSQSTLPPKPTAQPWRLPAR